MAELGRAKVIWPDLNDAGGAALETAVHSGVANLANNYVSKWLPEVTIANTAVENITHNFGMALADLTVIIFESGVPVPQSVVDSDYTVAQVSTDIISITNSSGGSKTFTAMVLGYNAEKISGRYAARLETTDATLQTLITVPVPTDKTMMISTIVCGRKDGTNTVAYRIEAFAEDVSGTVTVTEITRSEFEDVNYTCDVVVSGTNLIVRVAGEAATNVEWFGKLETTYI